VDGLPRLKKRTGAHKGKAEINDIVTIMQLLDKKKLLHKLPTLCFMLTTLLQVMVQTMSCNTYIRMVLQCSHVLL